MTNQIPPPPPSIKTISCAKCGARNISTTNFCEGCGASLSATASAGIFLKWVASDAVLYACMACVFIAIYYPYDDATGQLSFVRLFINNMVASLSDLAILPIPVLSVAATFLTLKKSQKPTLAVLAVLVLAIIRLQSVYYVHIADTTLLDLVCLYVMYISALVAVFGVYLKGRFQEQAQA